ncbi:MAG: PAS domain-containing sensor histidine kinase [Candidatus Lokiarchaeota archaeon]|nr:PAS domain-containing sensor histidine kinase [Candidatus Lokiarchaeota archaeon]
MFKVIEKDHNKKHMLRELERRYKLFYEYAPLPYQSLDEDTKIIDINQAWLDFLGYDKEEVIGKCFGEFLVLKSRELLTSRFSHFKEVGVIQDVEYEIVKKNGVHSIIWLDGRIEYDNSGNFTQAHCFFKDITERKLTEKKLKESEEKFRIIAEQSFMSIYIIQDGIFKYRNQRATDVSGYSSEDIKDWKPYEYAKIIHPEDRELVLEQSKKKQKGDLDVINRYKYRIIKKSGEVAWIDNFSKTINYKGRPADLVMTEDITEKIVAEQKLKESEEKYRYLFNNAQVGLYWSRISDGKFLECNEIFAKLFGYEKREELLEDYIATEHYVYPNQRNEILDAIRLNNEVRGYEILVTKKDGTPIWLSISARMFENENRIEGAAIDITKRKKAEQELLESEERYKKAYDKADFYKDLLAHDVGNILNNINASVQLMKIWNGDYNLSEKEKNMIEIIKQQLERGASLVSNVRKLSEIEEGEMSVKSMDAKKLIEKCIENIRSRFHEREIEISFNAVQEITNVIGGELLIDAFENLIINGIIHNDSKKIKLWINISKVNQEGRNYIKIEFKDNGLGIIDDRKMTIFKRNYEKDRSTGGMGIGLSLVKNIITSYGGQTWVKNRVKGDYSQGSNFIILLKEDN